MPDPSQSDILHSFTQPATPVGEPVVEPPPQEPTYAPGEPPNHRYYSEWDPRSAPGTYLLLGINVAVFLWMVLHGVSPTSPNSAQLLHYGANHAALVLGGQWWRLMTAIFVHIGLLHIATNMWCLWNLGLLGEPLLGPFGIVAVYLLTGVAGNLLSVACDVIKASIIHEPLFYVAVPGAGASGAVFGIAGILIILLSNRRLPIPWTELQRLRTSVVRFAAINLVIGASTLAFNTPIRIDNSAHIGGFLSGLALGPGLVPYMTAGRARYLGRQKIVFIAAAFILSLFGYWIANFK
jgi:rhomboid protease GluP